MFQYNVYVREVQYGREAGQAKHNHHHQHFHLHHLHYQLPPPLHNHDHLHDAHHDVDYAGKTRAKRWSWFLYCESTGCWNPTPGGDNHHGDDDGGGGDGGADSDGADTGDGGIPIMTRQTIWHVGDLLFTTLETPSWWLISRAP